MARTGGLVADRAKQRDRADKPQQRDTGRPERRGDRGQHDPAFPPRKGVKSARAIELPDRNQVEQVQEPGELARSPARSVRR